MPYVDDRLRGRPVPAVSVETMERDHIARLAAVKGSDLAFMDQRIPAYRREIINIIGKGVTENTGDPNLAPKVRAPAHGFAIAYARAPKGCGAALHRHPTEEVFVTLKGSWEVFWLEGEAERKVTTRSTSPSSQNTSHGPFNAINTSSVGWRCSAAPCPLGVLRT